MTQSPRKILSLSTYPIKVPRHGGQRRCAALGRYHRIAGHQFAFASAYDPSAYGPDSVTKFDRAVTSADQLGGGWAGDVNAGLFSYTDVNARAHFVNIARILQIDTISLEQPFMWPIAEHLLSLKDFSHAKLIYSSQNVEAPLKESLLNSAKLPRHIIDRVCRTVDDIERSVLKRADLIIAVSTPDAATYRKMNSTVPISVVSNGINELPAATSLCWNPELKEKYLLFVGSAHLPNRDGFLRLVLRDGVQYLPPDKSLAVAGGVAELIYNSHAYQRRSISNGDRVHFFPRPTDEELASLIRGAHGILLPIEDGGGTNLKTAEALLSGKWIVGTDVAFRGYEKFMRSNGVLLANNTNSFASAMIRVLAEPPLDLAPDEMTERKVVTWQHILRDFDISKKLFGNTGGIVP